MLGRPTIDTTKVMITMGMKEVFRHMERVESELIALRKKNELLRGHLDEIVRPIDLENLKIILLVELEKIGIGTT